MNCIIIDDEEMARAIMTQFVSNYTAFNVVGEFCSAIDALKFLNQNQVDLIFLDIHMPNFNGFDFIQTIKDPPNVILVTSDRNFAIEAFEYKCIVDYIVKPITEARFIKAVSKLKALDDHIVRPKSKSKIDDINEGDFYVNIDRRLIKIKFSSVNIIEARGDYIHIKTELKNYIVHSTLKKIEGKLPKDIFLKVHRSFMINTSKIIDIEDNSVLIGKDVVPVSRSNRAELLNKLNVL